MRITKYGHSCLLLEIDTVKILTDLGSWNPEVPTVTDLNAILITHEHADHFDVDKLQTILATNSQAIVITHTGVGQKLEALGIAYTPIKAGQELQIQGVTIESFGTDHAIIYGTTPPCQNTGYLVGGRVYLPGDALHDMPNKPVEILALPTGGPWMKIAEAVDYAKALKPKVVIPIHDAVYTAEVRDSFVPRWIGVPLEAEGIRFINMGNGSSEEFS